MNESELVEAIASFYALALTAIGLYVTVCSGYLVAAYMVGSKLTNLQALIISALYCFVASTMAYGAFGWLNRAFSYLDALHSLGDSGLGVSGSPVVGDLLTAIMVAGIFACIKFMLDIRQTKTE